MIIDNILWAVVNKFIYIFDIDTRMKIRIIEAYKVITKIALFEDLVCIGSDEGYIELISIVNHTFLLTTEIRSKVTIRNIENTIQKNVYALSTKQGLSFFTI